ncbi:hypothetical protein HMPREF1144_3600 [Klebsiella sp. OBRC7]|uniref:hypothetical protein n=1 Tax=Klebsiella michiganensis TaxID=1134687 RepID=UPI00027C624A|nr:hypothetical protein [Klebsiella michiganensis]EJU19406.1 hypothetical protein HMPREF1144_3600 [Klebsiella sp. OBRC7]MDM7005948.1 hypothetical protein [Klebsiella michiganensis]
MEQCSAEKNGNAYCYLTNKYGITWLMLFSYTGNKIYYRRSFSFISVYSRSVIMPATFSS